MQDFREQKNRKTCHREIKSHMTKAIKIVSIIISNEFIKHADQRDSEME